ncbi:MAG: DUF1016 family protein [Candidatus Omnitrophica bacterium]|nr:DUF1016 family protein [Candidatus Omnitrophota bacterium]
MKKSKVVKSSTLSAIPAGYADFLNSLKTRIRKVQVKVALSANSALVDLYWDIGQSIFEKQKHEAWGAKVIERLAADLSREFPGVEGLSRANLYRMRAFYLTHHQQSSIVAQTVRQLPWGHNIILVEKLSNDDERLWYAKKSMEQGWGRDTLVHQIKSDVFHRQGKAITNFKVALISPQSDLAQETLKDPYVFDFLTLTGPVRELEVEGQLVSHVAKLLLEMGAGFAFVGRQVPVVVAGTTYFLDLLFYHTHLRCYVVVELKAGGFKPEYAGKLNFYLSAVDDLIRRDGDQSTIGILLCRSKNKIDVEYAFRDIHKPMGVAEWETTLAKQVPASFRPSLPTVKEIEQALGDVE